MRSVFLLFFMVLLSSCTRSPPAPVVVEGVDVAALMRPQDPWPSSVSPDIARQPVAVRVAVSPGCRLCDEWRANWPSDVPVEWVWVSSGQAALDSNWCRTQARPLKECRRQLKESAKRFKSPSAVPVGLASDGRVLTGWPDADWLRTWSGRRPPPRQEDQSATPLVNI